MADIFGIGKIAEVAADAGKFAYGVSQAKKGEKQMNEAIDAIKYSRPEEYGNIMSLLEGRTNSVGSRQQTAEDKVKANTAGSVAGFTQIADSPVGALGGFAQLKARESQALADINLQYEGIKDEAILGEVKGQEMGAGYSDKEQYWNDMYKNQVHANMGASKMGGGLNMAMAGAEGMVATGLDYAGTKYLSNAYNPQNTQQPSSSNYGEGYDPTINWGEFKG